MKATIIFNNHEMSRSEARENVKGLKRQNKMLSDLPENPMRKAMIRANENIIKRYNEFGK